MSRPFAKYTAKTTFKQFNESLNAGDYISLKKTRSTFCKPNYCHPNKNLYSQSNYLLLRTANNIALNPCGEIDKNQLYINLITKLDLSDNVIVVNDLSNNQYPIIINTNVEPYLKYNIDPSGDLFGNNLCGIDNWKNYLRANTSVL